MKDSDYCLLIGFVCLAPHTEPVVCMVMGLIFVVSHFALLTKGK